MAKRESESRSLIFYGDRIWVAALLGSYILANVVIFTSGP